MTFPQNERSNLMSVLTYLLFLTLTCFTLTCKLFSSFPFLSVRFMLPGLRLQDTERMFYFALYDIAFNISSHLTSYFS